jgi:hypothetical protein
MIPPPRSPTNCVQIKKLKRLPRSTRAVEPLIEIKNEKAVFELKGNSL